jgi:hypothetical protein
VEGPNLTPSYGASCKPLALLTCKDVHPCRTCRATGFIDHAACGRCGGTGIAKIKRGSSIYCEPCSKSGKDHLPIMWRDPKTDPPPEPAPSPPPPPASTPKQETRRQRRARQSA